MGALAPAFVPASADEAAAALASPVVVRGLTLTRLPRTADTVLAWAGEQEQLQTACAHVLDACQRRAPDDSSATAWQLVEAARALRALHEVKLAAQHFQLAAEVAASRDVAAGALYLKAVMQRAWGDHAAARQAAHAGLKARPHSPELLRAAAHTAGLTGDHAAAVALSEQTARHGCFSGTCRLTGQVPFLFAYAWYEGACDVAANAHRQLNQSEQAEAAAATCEAAAMARGAATADAPLLTGLQAAVLAQRPEDLKVSWGGRACQRACDGTRALARLPTAALPACLCAAAGTGAALGLVRARVQRRRAPRGERVVPAGPRLGGDPAVFAPVAAPPAQRRPHPTGARQRSSSSWHSHAARQLGQVRRRRVLAAGGDAGPGRRQAAGPAGHHGRQPRRRGGARRRRLPHRRLAGLQLR